MRKVVVAGGAVVGLFAAYAGFNAWLAWGTPARPVNQDWPLKGCEQFADAGPNPVRASLQCRERQQEAALLKGQPGLAARDGDTLTVFYRGRQTHRIVPIDGDEKECHSVAVHRALALYDPASKQKEPVALISCHHGEFEDRFVALPDGARWTVHDATASPDGKIIAIGNNNQPDGSGFDLHAWPSRQKVAHFRPSCRVIKWRDETHIDVTCASNAAAHAFDARVGRGQDGVWRMQATRWLNGAIGHNDDGDLEVAPSFSLRPLPRFTGE